MRTCRRVNWAGLGETALAATLMFAMIEASGLADLMGNTLVVGFTAVLAGAILVTPW